MKKARTAIGIVVIGGTLAVLLSMPSRSPKYPTVPNTIDNRIYDIQVPKQKIILDTTVFKYKEKQVMFTINDLNIYFYAPKTNYSPSSILTNPRTTHLC